MGISLLGISLLLFSGAGCSFIRHKPKTETAAGTQTSETTPSEPAAAEPEAAPTPAAPQATVQIEYGRRDDYLQSLSVSKFASASLITTHSNKGKTLSVVRFEGGEPVWEIKADTGISGALLGHMPGIKEYRKFAITQVTYGVVPKGFSRQEPENSEPEPLEAGKYYIFTVRRASGSISYQAVHVKDDGSVESYDAQPRIGSSYALCCNLDPDFTAPSLGGESAAP